MSWLPQGERRGSLRLEHVCLTEAAGPVSVSREINGMVGDGIQAIWRLTSSANRPGCGPDLHSSRAGRSGRLP